MSKYATRLHTAVKSKRTPALVGLDPRWDQLPVEIRETATARGLDNWATQAAAYEEFCRRIIDVVASLVPAVKPQAAFFEVCGPAGMQALRNVIRHARQAGLIVICDAKRGDIGSTAEAYARAYLAGADPASAPFPADALTINPYLGVDTLKPFVDRAEQCGAGVYVLVRTSNPGAGEFQDRVTSQLTLFEYIAHIIEQLSAWSVREQVQADYGCVGAVVGATYPQELKSLREQMPHVPLLVPGYGSQGGTSADVAAAFDGDGLGALVNSSRGIIFAYKQGALAEQFGESRWEDAVQAAALSMINDLAAHTPAGQLMVDVDQSWGI